MWPLLPWMDVKGRQGNQTEWSNFHTVYHPKNYSNISSGSRTVGIIYACIGRTIHQISIGRIWPPAIGNTNSLWQCNSCGYSKWYSKNVEIQRYGNAIFSFLWSGKKRSFGCKVAPRIGYPDWLSERESYGKAPYKCAPNVLANDKLAEISRAERVCWK